MRSVAPQDRNDLSQHPFFRMVRLFAGRMFYGENDAESLDFGVGTIFVFLALPGTVASLFLLNKYSTLLQWMRGDQNFDPLAAAMPDEYFFIVLSMVITAGVAVWKWDSIFPDRGDFINLVPLPLSTSTIFSANLVALSMSAGLLMLDVNAASALLFPAVVCASQGSFSYFLGFLVVHSVTVTLASLFAFLVVFALLGLMMAVLPSHTFRRISPHVRAIVILCLLILLATSSAVPLMLRGKVTAIRFLPPAWFLGLCQSLRGRADPTLAMLSHLAWRGLFSCLAVAIPAYTVSYRRYFARIPETTDVIPSSPLDGFGSIGAWIHRLVFRTNFQRGCAFFVLKTLFRSERAGLIMAGFGGLGLVLASQSLMVAFERKTGGIALSADALSVPLILAYCVTVGLRACFEMPVDLQANWVFRLHLDPNRHECAVMARKVVLLFTMPVPVIVLLSIYAYLAGWVVAVLHVLLVGTWSALLADALLLGYRKVPFACAAPGFQQHAIVIVLAVVFGFSLFALFTSQVEQWALQRPFRMSLFLVPAAGIYFGLRYSWRETLCVDRRLIFEEAPVKALELLGLGN